MMAKAEAVSAPVTIDSAEEERISLSSEPESTSTAGSSTEETSSPPSVDAMQSAGKGVGVDETDSKVKDDGKQEKNEQEDQKDSEQENEQAEPAVLLPPRPDNLQQWTWRCHKCHTRYALAVTNRCLSDGHYFCYGLAQGRKHWGRRQRQIKGENSLGASCKSSFDYAGWEAMALWQRQIRQQGGASPSPGCWEDCKYPGECRQSRLNNVPLPSTMGLSGRETGTVSPNVRTRLAPYPKDASRVYQIFPSCPHFTLG